MRASKYPKQPKRSRLWLNDGSCIRLRPERPNHVWSWDFVFDRTDDGRTLKLMVVIDEYTRQCLAIHVARRIRARDAIDVFADLMETHGIPEHIRSDNGPEMVAMQLRQCSRDWVRRRFTLRRGARGRMATANPSTASCAMNC